MKKRLEKDEIRVMKLSREAIAEMLWESFMEMYHDRLDVPNDDHHVCHMTLNEDMSELTFYSCYSSSTQKPDFDAIDAFLKTEAVGAASIQTLSPINTQCFDSPAASAKRPERKSPPADDGL